MAGAPASCRDARLEPRLDRRPRPTSPWSRAPSATLRCDRGLVGSAGHAAWPRFRPRISASNRRAISAPRIRSPHAVQRSCGTLSNRYRRPRTRTAMSSVTRTTRFAPHVGHVPPMSNDLERKLCRDEEVGGPPDLYHRCRMGSKGEGLGKVPRIKNHGLRVPTALPKPAPTWG